MGGWTSILESLQISGILKGSDGGGRSNISLFWSVSIISKAYICGCSFQFHFRQEVCMTLDFHTNKKLLEEVAIIPSKRLRNKIVGFSTHLMKRI
ncbi:hypothetical protein JHK87_031863 [Glycine soja]|nr:hypothetical protein JHK87_031863 [Glycine soja]